MLLLIDLEKAPLVIKIAVVFIMVALGSTLLSYFTILRRRYNGNISDTRMNRIIPVIDRILMEEVIMAPSVPDSLVDAVFSSNFQRPMFRKRWVRQTMIDRMIRYRKNLRGEPADLLKRLFLDLELDKDSSRKIKSTRWDKKVQGLAELTSMDVAIADVNILPYTNSGNRELRAAARHAYIKLSKNEPFKFFDIATEPLLAWDKVELFKIITTSKDIAIPNFARWVTYSQNKSIISFCLTLISHYQQTAAIPAVSRLLDNKDHLLRADAISCLGKLRATEIEEKLMHIYSNQPLTCQIEILKALGRLHTGNAINFLRKEFLYSSEFDIRKEAARSLIRSREIAPGVIEHLMETSASEYQLILKHCMNPLIKF